MHNIEWKIGCSGFHYKDWKGIFYPESLPQKDWFSFYTQHFNTLELNTSFYRFPALATLEKWYDLSPPDFQFAVKAPRLITHFKKFSDCTRLLDDFYNLISRGLRDKLGPVLFQVPPGFTFTEHRLELIIHSLRKEYKNVVEFRHDSWWITKVFKTFKKEAISFCGIDYPGLKNKSIVTNRLAYYRFHGRPKLYFSAHKICDLKTVADDLMVNEKVKEAFVYFNNTATKAAIKNARWLKKYINSYD